MTDLSWIQLLLEWLKLIPDWVWATVCVIIGFFTNNYIAPRWKEIRKIEAQIEYMPELTKKVEDIKSDIGILREEITSVRAQGREAIRAFFESCNIFLNEFLLNRTTLAGVDDYADWDDYSHALEKHMISISMSHTRLFSYFHEEDSILKASDIAMDSLKKLYEVLREEVGSLFILQEMLKETEINPNYEDRIKILDLSLKQDKKYKAEIDLPLENFRRSFIDYATAMSFFFKRMHLKVDE